jgi:prevent-host-death family protein
MILVMSDVVLPLAEIKKHLSEIVDGVEDRHDRVVLTRHGRPAAVIISPDELESLEETLELLSDPRAMREIRSGEAAVEAGEVVTADDLRSRYPKR